jgi:UDP-glucuronate 4-epimerase
MDYTTQKILVTGAAGFIASHTAEALARAGAQVVGLDNYDSFYPRKIKERNCEEVRTALGDRAGNIRYVEQDFTDAAAAQELFERERFTGVVHLAARAGVRPSIEQPALYARVNVDGSTILLEAARSTGVQRFVQASSSSVYGNNKKVPFSESDDVNEPISPYAATKRSVELIAHTYWHLYKLPVASLRFFTVFGPRQRPDLAISKFIRLIALGEPIPMFGDGSTSRDYTYIDDIVSGVLAAYERIEQHGCRVWNLGGSDPVTLREMIATIERVVGRAAIIDQQAMQPGDVERTFADTSRSEKELGYKVSTAFEEGVRKQWEWAQRVGGVVPVG